VDFQSLRNKMVEEQIVNRGIRDLRVIEAMRTIPRHLFIPEEYRQSAYLDCPVPIGQGQTISQPYMVALMTEALKLTAKDRVLEVGTGSGYQTAILATLCQEVYSIERINSLGLIAQEILKKQNIRNVNVLIGDGSSGWPKEIVFDAIIVTAGAPDLPAPLIKQLDEGGRAVVPIGDRMQQTLKLITKGENQIFQMEVCQCVFVPLLGQFGWNFND
jgi:protein-L-isoaspartate(D-aspartate) O-methyltransferase